MDQQLPAAVPAEPAMPCCCAQCGAAFDLRTQQQLKMLQRFAELGMALAEAVAEFPLRTRHVDADVTQNFELLGRGARRCLALEAKLTEDARRRHNREAHGAPPPRDQAEPGERASKPLPPLTAEDEESVIGPEPVVRETAENLLSDTREKLLDRFVDDHSPAVVVAAICRDLKIEEDISVFMEPAPTRATIAAVEAKEAADAAEAAAEWSAVPEVGPDKSAETPPPGAKGRDPP